MRIDWHSFSEIFTTAATLAVLSYVCISIYEARNHPQPGAVLRSVSGNHHGVDSPAMGRILKDVKTKNLIVAVSPNCPFCRRSRSFYRSLIAVAAKQTQLQVLFAFPDGTEESELRSFLEGSSSPGLVKINFAKCGIDSTPTLILMDDKKKITRSWVGMLNSDQERDVLGTL